jgi:hypothetical protein
VTAAAAFEFVDGHENSGRASRREAGSWPLSARAGEFQRPDRRLAASMARKQPESREKCEAPSTDTRTAGLSVLLDG